MSTIDENGVFSFRRFWQNKVKPCMKQTKLKIKSFYWKVRPYGIRMKDEVKIRVWKLKRQWIPHAVEISKRIIKIFRRLIRMEPYYVKLGRQANTLVDDVFKLGDKGLSSFDAITEKTMRLRQQWEDAKSDGNLTLLEAEEIADLTYDLLSEMQGHSIEFNRHLNTTVDDIEALRLTMEDFVARLGEAKAEGEGDVTDSTRRGNLEAPDYA